MSQSSKKLVTLLKELFQLDRPDLDFGFYRIMHAKSAEVTQFLEQDLLPQVQAALSQYQSADKAAIEKELDETVKRIRSDGADPDTSPKVRDLRTRLAEEAVDLEALEAEVYDHLYAFFRRYYSEGDFLSKRVYKPGVYAIPYEGEEVKLHWANADQYYIKTSEYLRDYAFRLRPDDAADPMRVHFRLVDAAEGEHGNVRAAEGKNRVFLLRETDFIAEEDDGQGKERKELVIRFEYRPATLDDWPEEERKGRNKPPAQKDLIALAEQRVREAKEPGLARWIEALKRPHVTADGEPADCSCLRVHLNRYTARNTFDYFIHKDLDGFLRRELDFYIKNEVMHLDDVENETALRVEQYLSKIKVIRRIGAKIIDFLVQLENFQKKLWLKKKFVIQTNYCVTLGHVPESMYQEVTSNASQCEEWTQLFALDDAQPDLASGNVSWSNPPTVDLLKANPCLVLDTRYFNNDFTWRLLAALSYSEPLDDQLDGLLVHGENFQALNLLQTFYRRNVQSVYIDPPYNTDASAILYKNDYKDSSWLSLIADRLALARSFLKDTGILCAAIDDEEAAYLKLIMQDFFDKELGIASVRSNPAGRKSKGQLSPVHEYALFFGNSDAVPGVLEKVEGELARYPHGDQGGRYAWNNLVRHGSGDRREDRPKLFYPIYVSENNSLRVPEMRWDSARQEYRILEEPRNDEISVLPIKIQNGVRVEKRWHRGPDRITDTPGDYRVRRGDGVDNGNGAIDIDFKIRMDMGSMPKTWWDDRRYASANLGAKVLKGFFREKEFDFAKAVGLVEDCLRASLCHPQAIALDFFAGSGTTGHAVINLNREDGGRRKFILVEMGDYFDTVLLPRIKKVTFAPEWKDGKPKRPTTPEEAKRSPRIVKVVRLESYEDTLNNLEPRRTDEQQSALDASRRQGSNDFREQYLLRYMLDVETRGNPSLLNIAAFTDPTSYRLKVKRPGSDESREVAVYLLETFNWLIGLTVQRIAAPRTFGAGFRRDGEGRLRLKGQLKQKSGGAWWFRTVTGTMPDGHKALVVWRKRPGGEIPEGIERDNLVLDEWFTGNGGHGGFADEDGGYDLVYVNGDNNLENLKAPVDVWKVRLIEEAFHRLMFEPGSL